jgi:hypothetical protein
LDANTAIDNQPSNTDFPSNSSCNNVLPISNKNTLDTCASAIAQLQAAGICQTTVNSFVSSMEEAVQELQGQAKPTALTCVSSK